MVYGKAFFHPYFYHRYKSLIYLVTLKLWYGYGYWFHNLFLFLWRLSLPWLLFSVRFSLYNFYLEHNFDFFCGWSNFGYFVLLRFAFTTFVDFIVVVEKIYTSVAWDFGDKFWTYNLSFFSLRTVVFLALWFVNFFPTFFKASTSYDTFIMLVSLFGLVLTVC